MSANRKKTIYVFIISFVILLISLIIYVAYMKKNSHITRTYSCGDTSNDISVSIAPRGGYADSWLKEIDGGWYTGCIYEVKITNKSEYPIDSWKLTIKPKEKIYVNNAWCGKVKITSDEKSQTLDLRNLDKENIEVFYRQIEQDKLFPVEAGKTFEYLPDADTYEYPIAGKKDNYNKEKTVTIGLIIYYEGVDTFALDNYQVGYSIERSISDNPIYTVIYMGFIIWAIMLVFTVFVEIRFNVVRKRLKHDEVIIEQSLSVFTRFIDAKDTYTKGHSLRVAVYSRLIANKLGMSENECKNIYYIALMHDCGKIYISDDILKKPAKLTKEEYEIIKTHTTYGAKMLSDFTSIDGIIEGALYHHERYDGNGYPTGKSGENIPIIGRIICVADSFDAMNSSRCYRSNLTKDMILSELVNNKGKQFDPKIVDCLLELIDIGEISIDSQ